MTLFSRMSSGGYRPEADGGNVSVKQPFSRSRCMFLQLFSRFRSLPWSTKGCSDYLLDTLSMNPVLKKLSAPGQSASQIANLLEKHIGDGENEQICSEACGALIRIRDAEKNSIVRTTMNLASSDGSSCQTIKSVIACLRGFDRQHNDRDFSSYPSFLWVPLKRLCFTALISLVDHYRDQKQQD